MHQPTGAYYSTSNVIAIQSRERTVRPKMDRSGPVPHYNLVRSSPVQYHSLPNIRAGDRKLLQVKSRT